MSGVDIAGLVERLRKRANQAGMLLVDPPRPSPEMDILNRAADALLAQAAEMAEARGKQREGAAACLTVAELVALIPLRDTLAAAGTCKDFIAYFKRALAERDEALAALKASEERGEREGALGWNSEAEWEIEQRAFHAAGRADVPKDVQELVAILWKQYCIAAEPLENSKARLADATNNPPSDPGTEQREAGR